MIPKELWKVKSPLLTRPTVVIVVRVELWIKAVKMVPNIIPLKGVLVYFSKIILIFLFISFSRDLENKLIPYIKIRILIIKVINIFILLFILIFLNNSKKYDILNL